jgi:hypothetical protein
MPGPVLAGFLGWATFLSSLRLFLLRPTVQNTEAMVLMCTGLFLLLEVVSLPVTGPVSQVYSVFVLYLYLPTSSKSPLSTWYSILHDAMNDSIVAAVICAQLFYTARASNISLRNSARSAPAGAGPRTTRPRGRLQLSADTKYKYKIFL